MEPMKLPMSFDDFMRRVLEAVPQAQVEEDNDGQIIIYTNLRKRSDNQVDIIDPYSTEE